MNDRKAGTGGRPRAFDRVLGLIGSVVVGATVWVVISGDAAMLGMFLIGGAGAALAIVAQRRCWRSARLGA